MVETEMSVAGLFKKTTDDGYIVGGYSNSSGTGNISGTNNGGDDYWIIKIDSEGVIDWENLIGGSGTDQLYDVKQTSDGGYILGGWSSSSVSGDVSGTNHGNDDVWVVKLDATGSILWENLYGGNNIERAWSIVETSDNGYVVAAYSSSSTNGDVSGINHGGADFWIIKLNASGVIVWENLFGGIGAEYPMSVNQCIDGGYIIAGPSSSSESGDVSGTNLGSFDFWIIKVDGSGTLIWERNYGGSNLDEATSIICTIDGGYFVVGPTQSSESGDVSGINNGSYDCWFVKLDNSGNLDWEVNYGGNGTEWPWEVCQTSDGGYIITSQSTSSVSGDVTGINHGNGDYWIVKLDADGNIVW